MSVSAATSLSRSSPARPSVVGPGRVIPRARAVLLVVAMAFIVGGVRWLLGEEWAAVAWASWAGWLVALAQYDAHTLRLPRVATLPAVGAAAAACWALRPHLDLLTVGAAVAATSGLWTTVAWMARRRAGVWTMGLGDALFMAPTAILLGAYDLGWVAAWCALAAALWALLTFWERQRRPVHLLPCGPVLAVAALMLVPWVGS